MAETKNINICLNEIPEMPTFRPTLEEFENPIDYIE